MGGAAASVDGRRLPAGPAEEAHPSRLPAGAPLDCVEGTDGPAFTVSTLPFAAVHTCTIPGPVLGRFFLCSVNIIQLWSLGCVGRE